MKIVNREQFQEKALATNEKYWLKSYWKRWEYQSVVVDMLNQLDINSILEAGTMGIPLALDGCTLDINDKTKPTYIHDLTEFPYPFRDKEFDMFVALQVWEHIGDNQHRAFKEVCRIAKNIILSFPYKWKAGSACHLGIDKDVIKKWTEIEPDEIVQVKGRIIYRWKF